MPDEDENWPECASPPCLLRELAPVQDGAQKPPEIPANVSKPLVSRSGTTAATTPGKPGRSPRSRDQS